ncbi:MAG TPA: WG repeat-containing protein [Chitinophagales bacterium]|nr:WG repeat-containing protein [Chitinophagales bacterium]
MKTLRFLTIQVLFILCQDTHAQDTILFEEHFDDNAKGWLTGEDQWATRKFKNGKYYMECKAYLLPNSGTAWSTVPGLTIPNDNFSIQCRTEWIKNKNTNGYYHSYGFQVGNYRFEIYGNGDRRLMYWDGEKDNVVVDYTGAKPSLFTKEKGVIDVKIEVQNGNAKMYGNDQLMLEKKIGSTKGQLQLRVSHSEVVTYDDLIVTKTTVATSSQISTSSSEREQDNLTQYVWVYPFSEGLALVNIGGTSYDFYADGGAWGYIDKSGKVIITCKYDFAKDFREGLAAVQLNGKWGFIDKTGKEVIPFQYEDANSFSEGFAAVKSGGTWRYIDKTGKEKITGVGYSGIFHADNFSEGLAWVSPDEKINNELQTVCIDKNGKTIIWPKYKNAGRFSDGLAFVELDYQKSGFIDKTGKEVIPLNYLHAYDFSEGLAAVQHVNGKWGFVDTTGKEIISIKYEAVRRFHQGLAAVQLNGKWGYIDKSGKEMITCKYDFTYGFSESLAAVNLNGKWGFIDETGRIVISPQYERAENFTEGFAAVKLNGRWTFIDKAGKEIK